MSHNMFSIQLSYLRVVITQFGARSAKILQGTLSCSFLVLRPNTTSIFGKDSSIVTLTDAGNCVEIPDLLLCLQFSPAFLCVENKKNENKIISNNNNNIPKKEIDEIDTEKNKNKNDRYMVVRSKKRKPVAKKIKMDESHKEKGKYIKRTYRTYVDELETSYKK